MRPILLNWACVWLVGKISGSGDEAFLKGVWCVLSGVMVAGLGCGGGGDSISQDVSSREDLGSSGETREHEVEEHSSIKWSFKTEGEISTSPAVSSGVAYLGSHDGNLYVVDSETGEQQWVFRAGGWISASPVVSDSVVYFGTRDGVLHAVSIESKQEKWSFKQKGTSPPLLPSSQASLCLEAMTETFTPWTSKPGKKDGALRRQILCSRHLWCLMNRCISEALMDTSMPWMLRQVRSSGASRQTKALPPPLLCSRVVYVVSVGGHLYALDIETGEKQWSSNPKASLVSLLRCPMARFLWVAGMDTCTPWTRKQVRKVEFLCGFDVHVYSRGVR